MFRAMIHSAGYSAAALGYWSGHMRIAIAAMTITLISASSPVLASPSCMTQGEARAKFPTQHLWWHGPGRCWDATPGRTQLSKRAKPRETKPAEPEEVAERVAPEDKQADLKRKYEAHAARWRDAMSKMRPDDMPDRGASARAEASVGPSLNASSLASAKLASDDAALAPRSNFWDRWVDIAQRAPPVVDKAGPADLAADAEPIVTPIRVMLGLLVLMLAFGAFELLLRRPLRRAD